MESKDIVSGNRRALVNHMGHVEVVGKGIDDFVCVCAGAGRAGRRAGRKMERSEKEEEEEEEEGILNKNVMLSGIRKKMRFIKRRW